MTKVITFLTHVTNMITRPRTNNINYSHVFFASKTRGSISLFRIPELLALRVHRKLFKVFFDESMGANDHME